MIRRSYDLYWLEGRLAEYERTYRIPSDFFYRMHLADDEALLHMKRFDRHVWASVYRDAQRLTKRKEAMPIPDLLDSDGPDYDPDAYAEGIDLMRKRERENPEPEEEPDAQDH